MPFRAKSQDASLGFNGCQSSLPPRLEISRSQNLKNILNPNLLFGKQIMSLSSVFSNLKIYKISTTINFVHVDLLDIFMVIQV